jgi:hypothetical protein
MGGTLLLSLLHEHLCVVEGAEVNVGPGAVESSGRLFVGRGLEGDVLRVLAKGEAHVEGGPAAFDQHGRQERVHPYLFPAQFIGIVVGAPSQVFPASGQGSHHSDYEY